MARIVCIGSALQDIYMVDHDDLSATKIGDSAVFGKVLVGSKVDVDKVHYDVGGGGINTAISLSRQGHEVVLLTNVANDSAGEKVMWTLDKEGIDSSYVNVLNRSVTGTSVILLDSKTGERTILTCRGASTNFSNLTPDDLDLIQPDFLYVTTLCGDMNTLLKFFEKAHEIGAKIMFNPGASEIAETEKLIGLLADTDVLIMNKEEAAKIVPGKILSELLYHLGNYVETVIITDGAMGGIATNGEEVYRFGIYEDVKVRDVTGAGDAFGAGFLARLLAGHSFRNSLVFASANSASVVSKIGATTGILDGTDALHPMPIQKI